MAEAIVAGIVKQGVVEAAEVCVTDINEERLDHFSEQYGVGRSTDNARRRCAVGRGGTCRKTADLSGRLAGY